MENMKTNVIKQEIENWLITAQYPIDAKAALQKVLYLIDSLQEKPNAKFKVNQTITDPTDSTFTFHINKIEDGRYIEKEDEWVLVKEADANYELVEEPVSEELEEELSKLLKECEVDAEYVHQDFLHIVARHFANWQKEQFEKDCADLCNSIATAKGLAVTMAYDKGMADAREQMMANATEVTVHIDAGGYPYTPEIELYDYDKDVPLAKEGDKYKVVLIKEE